MRGIFCAKVISLVGEYDVLRERFPLSIKVGEFLHQWFIFAPVYERELIRTKTKVGSQSISGDKNSAIFSRINDSPELKLSVCFEGFQHF